jgi:hypothetical protein
LEEAARYMTDFAWSGLRVYIEVLGPRGLD